MASFTADARTPAADQNHDSIPNYGAPIPPDDPRAEPVDITALQQMLSATSGSLLTGLLGASLAIHCLMLENVTLT